MSKLSIFEPAWIDLVFEGRNKEYGAYQLRRENPKTTIRAFFLALALLTTIAVVPMLIDRIWPKVTIAVPEPQLPTVTIRDVVLPPRQEPPGKRAVLPAVKAAKSKPSLQQAIVVDPDQATPVQPTATDPGDITTPATGLSGGSTNGLPASAGGGTNEGEGAGDGTNKPHETAVLDKMPMYPGGMDRFYQQVGTKFAVPEEGLADAATIRVLVSFVIEEDGSMTEIKVLQNPGYGMDKEAIRVLKSMKTRWEPGILDEKAVRVIYKLPIRVKTR